ncbi:MAG TPA: type II secretion system protein GspM [Sphingopyxis sp.]|nr:type II secretion system protein GspM [Sphingopyxis sp.]
MMDAVKNWWNGLSMRERWLVGVAGVLAVGVLGWGLGRPAGAAFARL